MEEHCPFPPTPQRLNKEGEKITWIGGIVNVFLSLTKIGAGFLTGSHGLVADGIHSFSDLISDGIVLFALKMSGEPSDAKHPYGHGRFESIGAMAAAVLLGLAAIGIFADGLRSLFLIAPPMPGSLALIIAGSSLIVKELLFRVTAKIALQTGSDALMANAWHHRSDALSSIAVVAGLIGSRLGAPFLDPTAACFVSFFIGHAAWEIGITSFRKLTDETVEKEELESMKRAALSVEKVTGVHKLRARWMGPDLMADLHIVVNPEITVREGHQIGSNVRDHLLKFDERLAEVIVHIEPDDPEHRIKQE